MTHATGHSGKRSASLPTEHEEQVTVVQWAAAHEHVEPRLRMLFAIPNAGAGAQKGQAGKMRAEGVKAGVPDLCLPVRAPYAKMYPPWSGLYIEMKRRKGGRTSPEQQWWHDALRGQGYRVEVCRGADAAIEVLRDYLGMSA